ncbi:MAG: LamG domain-containing protein, partial [bacterium]|nr:LamG domain-containing protein [bacterium]
TISNPVNASLGLYTNYNYTIVENDRKGPAITAAGYYDTDSNGFLDHIKITLDKTVDDSTFDGYGGTNALGSVTSKWAIAGYSNVRLDTSYSGDVDDDTVIWLAFDEQANTYDTGNTPELTVTDASLTDLNTGNCYFNTSTAACSTQTDADLAAGGVTETDKAPPVIVDAVSDIDFSLLFVMFSEPVDSNGGTCDTSLNADDLSYNNASNNNVSDKTPICIDCTACSDSSVSFVLDGNFAAADAGTDTINAVLSSVYDSADNSAEVTPLVITAVSDYAGFYPLNGNGNDESGNSNPFTSLAFEDKNRDGAEPGSYFLNEALANVLKITDSSNFDFTTEMTISIWVKVSNADSEPKIIGKVNAAMNRGYVLGVSFNEFSSQVWDSAGTLYTITSGTVLSGTWTHLAMTWNTGGKLRGYVNGELVQEVDTGANPIAVGGIGANFCAGAAPWDGSSNQMEGNIDDIRMYGRELSSTEISVLSSLPAD